MLLIVFSWFILDFSRIIEAIITYHDYSALFIVLKKYIYLILIMLSLNKKEYVIIKWVFELFHFDCLTDFFRYIINYLFTFMRMAYTK